MTLKQIEKVFTDLKKFGVHTIFLQGGEGPVPANQPKPMKAPGISSLAALLAAALVSLPVSAGAQILNTAEIAQLTLGNDSDTHDLWAENNFVYVARGPHGADIINATDITDAAKKIVAAAQ